MSKTKTLIRSIYLYLAVFVGLMMFAIPAGQLLKLGMQTWFFPLALEQEYRYDEAYPTKPYINRITEDADLATIKLTEEEVEILANWQTDYKKWQEDQDSIDWRKARVQNKVADNLSILIIGLIVFLSHGYVLRRDKKKDN
ncbi:MAG: hypothetical protein HOA57_03820 [Candidatus Magasanikbacteria bacterium]|jgi:hypothetical protein|nr:hypothetical protein [Candidatus Magasanikbacteria bacterium]MBT4315150.1 hypothetical protein [Candidatus Magasanikbacteria bacterium]MBT4547394.1 hypothetical protein [Candidatus Magasanikbacteria bacterium]MBT6819475.1 hypothetical protein [Candidatus Magasanikbacteria bacterium]